MEQIAMDIKNEKDTLREQLYAELVRKIDDPELSEYLSVESLGGEKCTGLSIKAKSSVAARIQYKKSTGSYIEFRIANSEFFPKDLVSSLNDEWNRVFISNLSDIFDFIDPIAETFVKVLLTYEHVYFGCCSRYLECSNAGQCVHPSKIKSQSCQYKVHLEHGQIFYGEKRNNIK